MKRLILGIVASAAATLGCGGGGGSVALADEGLRDSPVYCALGDSIAFGFSSDVYPKNDNVYDATAYPWYLASLIDIPLVNAACEGQASDGFITYGASDRGCFEFRRDHPDAMHVAYGGSQLDFAVDYLATHSRVRLVTIMLGADDVQLLADRCAWDPACIGNGLPQVLQRLAGNMAIILGTLQAAPGDPRIVIQNYYSPYLPATPFEPVVLALNGTLKMVGDAFGLQTADVYGAFKEASEPYGGDPCAAGLLQVHPDGTCSVHPSPAGARLIADTIAPLVAPWTGKP